MQVIDSVADLRACLDGWRMADETIGFVPTMGNLHQGHMALVERASKECTKLVASIFVNPTQFGENEDLGNYPRTLEADSQLLEPHCDCLFIPRATTIYPGGNCLTGIDIPPYTSKLCGHHRPGHFVGVLTVVNLLFNLVQPRRAYFGLKDYQQWWLIQRMVADLHCPVDIIGVDTGRADDGLALSSRNQYLSNTERRLAPGLYQQLGLAAAETGADPLAWRAICQTHQQTLNRLGFRVDYFTLRQAATLLPPPSGQSNPDKTGELVLLAAAWLGKARLIDNIRFTVG